MADERHPLDRAFAALREATLRRAAARNAGADDTARVVVKVEHHAPSPVPESTRRRSVLPPGKAKLTAAVGVVVSVLWALWEIYLLARSLIP